MITYTDKQIGDLFTAANANQIKEVVNNNLFRGITNLQVGLPAADGSGDIHVSGTYLITGEVNIGTNEIVLDADTHFIGLNSYVDHILYTGTNAAVRGTGFTFTSVSCYYDTPNGRAFNMTGATDKFFALLHTGLRNQAIASTLTEFTQYASFNVCWVVDGAGIEFEGVSGKAVVFGSRFSNSSGVEITTLANFEGILSVNENFFRDEKGEHIEIEDTTNVRARIIANDFLLPLEASPSPSPGFISNFVGFSEATIGVEVIANTNQLDSRVALDAGFSDNAVAQTITTTWQPIDQDFLINYAQRVVYDLATTSMEYTGIKQVSASYTVSLYAESAGNNASIEFALFADSGAGFERVSPIFPYEFRVAGTTELVLLTGRLTVPPVSKFRTQMRVLSGTEDITIINAKAVV